jgi:hypothetical protein
MSAKTNTVTTTAHWTFQLRRTQLQQHTEHVSLQLQQQHTEHVSLQLQQQHTEHVSEDEHSYNNNIQNMSAKTNTVTTAHWTCQRRRTQLQQRTEHVSEDEHSYNNIQNMSAKTNTVTTAHWTCQRRRTQLQQQHTEHVSEDEHSYNSTLNMSAFSYNNSTLNMSAKTNTVTTTTYRTCQRRRTQLQQHTEHVSEDEHSYNKLALINFLIHTLALHSDSPSVYLQQQGGLV